jgi:hypothetical protein
MKGWGWRQEQGSQLGAIGGPQRRQGAGEVVISATQQTTTAVDGDEDGAVRSLCLLSASGSLRGSQFVSFSIPSCTSHITLA